MENLVDGYVKGVLSGDLIIVSGKLKKNSNDVPEEKNLFLNFVQAPKINSQTTYEEEPLAWESRSFLRKLLVGKVIKYTVDYKINDNQFGQVYLDGKFINAEILKNGYGKLNSNKSNDSFTKSDVFQKVKSAEAEAQKGKLGIWRDNLSTIPKRKITKQDDVNNQELFSKIKGTTVNGMIEVAFNCNSLLVVLDEPYNCIIKASLRFVAIPNKDSEFYKSGKGYVERLFAHRDVKVKIVHLEEKNFIVDIWDTRLNQDGKEEVKNLAQSVLSGGYSKLFVPSSFVSEKTDVDAARTAQVLAQQANLRVWEGFIPKKETNQTTQSTGPSIKLDDFEGMCFIVHSGDSLTIKSDSGVLHRVFLSHIKAPAFAKVNSDEEDKPWAWQAKEHLRKSSIGKRVKAVFDYSKDINGKVMNFFSVFRYQTGKEDAININVDLLELGYASYISPKQNDTNVSKFISDYADAEIKGKTAKKGLHSTKLPGNPNYCDLIQANPKKKKDFLNRNSALGKNVSCVVEHVFSGIRLKLRIDKTTCFIPFKLIGLKTVEKDPNNTKQLNDLFDKSVDFLTEKFMQREGTCDIVQHDKNGNYFGFLTINGINVGAELLKEGYAIVHNPQGVMLPDFYSKIETKAALDKVGIWAQSGLSKILKESDMINQYQDSTVSKLEPKDEMIKIRISDMVSFNHFYANIFPNKNLATIEKTLSAYDDGSKKAKPLDPPIRKGTLCILYYQSDLRHYRVIITAILKEEKFEVDFIDYGTIDVVEKRHLFKMDDTIVAIEPQCVICELAGIKFSVNSKKKSHEMYPDFIDLETIVPARVAYTYSSYGKLKYGVVIYFEKGTSTKESMHYELISRGFAKLDSKKSLPKSLSELKEFENKAKEASLGMWAQMEESDNEDDANDI